MLCSRNIDGINEIHISKERVCGGSLPFYAMIHQHEHTAFGLTCADQLPGPQQVRTEVRIAPEIRLCLTLGGGRQHSTVLRPQGCQTQGLERLKEGVKRRLMGGLCSVMHDTFSQVS